MLNQWATVFAIFLADNLKILWMFVWAGRVRRRRHGAGASTWYPATWPLPSRSECSSSGPAIQLVSYSPLNLDGNEKWPGAGKDTVVQVMSTIVAIEGYFKFLCKQSISISACYSFKPLLLGDVWIHRQRGVKMVLSVITAQIELTELIDFLIRRCYVNPPMFEYLSCKFDPPRLFKIGRRLRQYYWRCDGLVLLAKIRSTSPTRRDNAYL